MTNNATGASADTEAMKANLSAMLGEEPVAEAMEEEAVKEVEEKIETKDKPKAEEKESASKDVDPEKKVLVPHAAFHEERERRKELQKRVAEQDESYKKLEERQNKILEALASRNTQPQEQEYVDPLVALEREVTNLKGTIQKSAEQVDTDNKNRDKEFAFFNKYKASTDAFAKDSPDFMEAYNFLVESRKNELSVFIKDPNKLNNRLIADERSIVEEAFNNEENPGEVLFNLAKSRGYKVKAPDKKIEDIDKGLKASKSLGNAGGKSDNDITIENMSASDLADLSDEEFNAMFAKIEKQAKRK